MNVLPHNIIVLKSLDRCVKIHKVLSNASVRKDSQKCQEKKNVTVRKYQKYSPYKSYMCN